MCFLKGKSKKPRSFEFRINPTKRLKLFCIFRNPFPQSIQSSCKNHHPNILIKKKIKHILVVAGAQYEHPAQYRYPFIKPASSFSSLPSSAAKYDYIVVGGGTAGCPLAATLSRNYTVLLLERGGTPFANSNVSFMQNFHITLADTSEKSASQMFISTDGVFNARGRVLGGGTAINAGFYTRASARYNSPLPIKKI